MGLGAGGLGSHLLALAPARVRRPSWWTGSSTGISPRQAAARRCRRDDPARRQPRRNRAPAGGGADAFPGLASAALFREENGVFRRRASAGWEAATPIALGRRAADRRKVPTAAFRARSDGAVHPSDARFPADLARPVLGVPVGNPRRCFAVVLYGGHEAEPTSIGRARLLASLARDAEIAYAQSNARRCGSGSTSLEGQLAHASGTANASSVADKVRIREALHDEPVRRLEGVRACVFDAYGTLFDFASAASRCSDVPKISARR